MQLNGCEQWRLAVLLPPPPVRGKLRLDPKMDRSLRREKTVEDIIAIGCDPLSAHSGTTWASRVAGAS
jgi:hypothetical protein